LLSCGQVEVLALPYYRHGKLVDMRYLHLVDGRLEASWLAAQAGQPYMIEAHLQVCWSGVDADRM
jgi:hypothetical protein